MAAQTIDTTALDHIAGEIAEKEQAIAEVSRQIGDAYARQRRGDRKASSDLGKLGAKRSKLESELSDLRLTQRSLEEQAEADAARAAEQYRQGLRDDLEATETEARRLERQLGEQVTAAAQTAQRLRAAEDAWARIRAEAGKAGIDVRPFSTRPAPASPLLRADVIREPERAVALWRNQYIEKTEIPPRQPTSLEVARKREAEALEAARRAQRQETAPAIFVIDEITRKRGA